MRILIKGGVWKNTEDEILKAAVMKYGKNAWARVASLLNRKSAKQCKARWYEWLDPSIKKTEWNKDEEEKLLHLAKLMPNQWRTIAPIVGRTAQQCMEHYEKLLSQAEEDSGEPSSSTDDPRRLRPGEIDPAPETKPARPDPIDMDEDEKEMLSEARARLANTKGKKAKRKIRERTMGEARRLAMLQKRRELKAAGIESKLGGGGNKKRKYIDYATEIPFQKVPPAGFYDVGEERQAGSKMGLDPTKQGVELAKLEGQHRRDDDEKNRKKDQRAMKKLYEENAPLAVARASAENDPATIRKRMPLALPAPQVSDNELEEIVKLGEHAMLPPTGGPGAGVTQALIGDYSQSHQPLPTPLRTPMQEDVIMQEAKNQRALREMTPLFDSGNSGELPELYEGTGFQGAMPKRADAPTPNTFRSVLPGATPSRALTAAGGATPLVGGSAAGSLAGGVSVRSSSQGGGLARATPLRDQFGLNVSADDGTDDNFSVSDMGSVAAASALMGTGAGGRSMAGSVVSSRAELARTKQIRKQLSQQLQSLPEPEFTYEVALPQDAATVEDVEDEEEDNMNDARRVGGTVSMVRDAAEVQQAALRLRQQREAEELERRSSVMKRGLPRPTLVPDLLAQPTLSTTAGYTQQLVAASAEVNREMVALMRHDDVQFPQQVSAEVRAAKLKMEAAYERAADLEVLPKDYIQQAQMLIRAEYTRNGGGARVSNSESDSGANGASKLDMESFNKAWDELHSKLMFIPDSKSLGGGTFAVPKNKKEALLALKTQFTALKARFEKYAKKAGKLENKLKVTTQGYQTRAEQLQQGFYTAYDLCSKTRIERECFASLHGQEQRAVARRISQLQAELKAAQEAESTAQQQYADIQGLCRELGIV